MSPLFSLCPKILTVYIKNNEEHTLHNECKKKNEFFIPHLLFMKMKKKKKKKKKKNSARV